MKMAAVDIMGPFPQNENGNCYILVGVDYLTKLLEAWAIYQTRKLRQLHKNCWKKCFFVFPCQIDCIQIKGGNSRVNCLKNCVIVTNREDTYYPLSSTRRWAGGEAN